MNFLKKIKMIFCRAEKILSKVDIIIEHIKHACIHMFYMFVVLIIIYCVIARGFNYFGHPDFVSTIFLCALIMMAIYHIVNVVNNVRNQLEKEKCREVKETRGLSGVLNYCDEETEKVNIKIETKKIKLQILGYLSPISIFTAIMGYVLESLCLDIVITYFSVFFALIFVYVLIIISTFLKLKTLMYKNKRIKKLKLEYEKYIQTEHSEKD